MKTINEQIIDNYEDLVSKLVDTLTVLKTCVSTKRVTERDENKLSSLSEQIDGICDDISKLKAQAEQTPAQELSNNRQQSEDSANNLKTAEEILKGEMSENLWTFICSYPVSYKSEEKLVEWIIDAMQEYAAQFKAEKEKVTDKIPKSFKTLFRCLEDSCYEINFYGNDGNDNQEKIDGKELLIRWIKEAYSDSQQEKVTDEDIMNEARKIYNIPIIVDPNSLKFKHACIWYSGAKAMRDGLITHNK